jgi:ankyrin repeat protein
VTRVVLWAAMAVSVYAQAALEAELVQAAETGDVAKVRALLEAGANPSLPRNFSALEAASAAAYPRVVEELLKHHPNVNQRDSAGRTALNALGQSAVGRPGENPAEVARLLIHAGADVNAQDNIYANTPLHEVPDAASAKVLIQAGANLNRRNVQGQTALMLTLDSEVARALLEAGADKAVRDHKGKTALDLARELQLTEKIALLK